AENRFRARVGQPTGECVLVEGRSKRDKSRWVGRADGGFKVVFDDDLVLPSIESSFKSSTSVNGTAGRVPIQLGDYVQVMTTSSTSTSFQGKAMARTSLGEFSRYHSMLMGGQSAPGFRTNSATASPLVAHLGLGSMEIQSS